MDLSKYEELTGRSISTGKTAFMTAQLKRAQSMLETLLGYTLSPENVATNFYNELGKTTSECACPSVDTEDLTDPDDVVGAYRLYDYNHLDQFFHVDPFSKINKVKLVYVKQGDGDNGVTIKTFSDGEIKVRIGRDGIGKYIEHCQDCLCVCSCDYNCVQLAVDAEWLWGVDGDDEAIEMPVELQYVLTDMVTWYGDPKLNVKSESITTHSYTRFDNTPPEQEPMNLSVIKRYAGPHGSVTTQPTTGGQGRSYGRVAGL